MSDSKLDDFGKDFDKIQSLFHQLQIKYPFAKEFQIVSRGSKLDILSQIDVDDL